MDFLEFLEKPMDFWKIQEASLDFLEFLEILRGLASFYTTNCSGSHTQTWWTPHHQLWQQFTKKRQTCMSTSLPTVGWHPDSPLGAPAVFHVAPCLRVFYFVATVSNSAVRARRENMTVFWVVSGCLYLSCWSPCVLFANGTHDKPDTGRPADHQQTVKNAGWLVSWCLVC